AGAIEGGEREQHLTAAQKQWADAQRKARSGRGVRRDM
nr:Holliday junction resolvase [Alloscardovia omnicolens]